VTRVITGGVDTHADVHVAAALDSIGGLLGIKEFPATPTGYVRLLDWLCGFGTVCLAGIEGTGSYGGRLRSEAAWAHLLRRRPDPGILGQDRPPPAQPWRRPPGQPRVVADRVHPHGLRPGHPCLRRTPHGRRKIQGGDHPLSQALRRPRGLPPPPHARGLTHLPGGGLTRESAAASVLAC